MIDFEEWLMNVEYPVPEKSETANIAAGERRTKFKFSSHCRTNGNTPSPHVCEKSVGLLDFIYDRKENRYALDRYKTDEDLVKKIRTGKRDPNSGPGDNIFVELFLGGTTPRIIE